METVKRITIKYWPILLLAGLLLLFFYSSFMSDIFRGHYAAKSINKPASLDTTLISIIHDSVKSQTHSLPGPVQELSAVISKSTDTPKADTISLDTTNSDLKAVISKLFKAKAAYIAPDTVLVGKEFPVKLVLEPLAVAKNFKAELQKQLNMMQGPRRPTVIVDTIQYSGTMEATLQTDDLTAKLINPPAKKIINPLAITTWNWAVTPKNPGTYYVYLDLLAYVKLRGTETSITIQSWQPVITVNVTTWDKFWHYVDTAEGKTEVITKLIGFIMGSGGLYGFVKFLQKLASGKVTSTSQDPPSTT